jgi:indolepyruvate ferredoxin oxidoreductase
MLGYSPDLGVMKLSDKYEREEGLIYLTGIQALVRLPIEQMRRDRRAGLNTGAFISGYEGSPLGGYDLALARARAILSRYNIHFQPGVNEDIAATSVMGSQIVAALEKPTVDGVVGIWYGKGPGVDRTGDAFRHANMAGSGRNSAALVLAGDDHSCKSSTIPHQSDFSLFNLGIPFFYPGNTQEILDYGLLAIALSRYSGAWVGMKLVTDVCDGGGTVRRDPQSPQIVLPEGYIKHTDARLMPPVTLALEEETNVRRLDAAREFARANRVNRWYGARAGAWLGVASAGKSYFDLAQALRDLGLDEAALERLGVRIAKFGMTFPLDGEFAREFASGLEAVIVVEEKRSFIEMQLRDALYSVAGHPVIAGKYDERGAPLFPSTGELNPDRIAAVVGEIIARRRPVETVLARLDRLGEASNRPRELLSVRAPNFCSGCPHNRSTLLLPGQAAGGGIGCHTMAMILDDPRRTFSFVSQMGGEGAAWIGMRPFVERDHIFQNIGDGTFFHSGSLALEACVAAGVNVTYKILYNGHVAMTGGQDIAGALGVPALTRKLEAEGVRRTVVLTEDVRKYRGAALAGNAEVRDRSELERTLAEMEKLPGVTAIIYDQECAAEKRRKRSRAQAEEPVLRLVINEEVCEGCGDCVTQSNCMSLNPVETEFGQKMRIHQSSCNKDYTCALGDCPSFVTVKLAPGAGIRRRTLPDLPPLEAPPPAQMVEVGANGYRIFAPGIGGTGVVTINALLATAASLDGLWVVTLDQTGTAQKGGAVASHILLSRSPIDAPGRTNAANADLLLGFDLVGAANPDNLGVAAPDRTAAVINTNLIPTIDSIRGRTAPSAAQRMLDAVSRATDRRRSIYVDASRVAESLFGTHMAVNLFLLGVAWQAGLIPVSAAALDRAIELNGVEVERNRRVFLWGRKYYQDAAFVEGLIAPRNSTRDSADPIRLRADELRAYQNERYARQYLDFVALVAHQAPPLKDTVARCLYKLMAYKDEYEVARLLTKPSFEQQVREMWESPVSISYNLHPPLLRRFGARRKMKLGPWFRFPLRALAAMKFVRGTPLDPFGYMAHRRVERSLPAWYRDLTTRVIAVLNRDNTAEALEILSLPDQIRGYEKLKEASIESVKSIAAQRLHALEARARSPVVSVMTTT